MTARLERRDGLRLGAWLETRPPTQAEIARQAGVSRQYIHKVVKGEARPTPRVLQACADLGMPVEKLVGEAVAEL